MPYIKADDRLRVMKHLNPLLDELKAIPDDEIDGVLNYVISRIVASTLGWCGWRYRLAARAIAVFEAAKLEFYRRIAAPYEDRAIAKNGDIPEYQQ
jgi:hypothetical protein